MYLLDTNIWLERLLDQEQSEVVGQLLEAIATDQILISDFTLHSIGIILSRLKQESVFLQFVQDILIDSNVNLIRLTPLATLRVVTIMELYQLDFDDAYQYVVAEQEKAAIVTFDRDFDRTEGGRLVPNQVISQQQNSETD